MTTTYIFNWIPFIVFLLHCAEEYPFFPQWATRHFGATSKPWYVYSHIVLFFMMIAICAIATVAEPQTWGKLILLSLMWSLCFNALFHIVSTIAFKEYSPGVVTGTLLFIPLTCFMSYMAIAEYMLTWSQFLTALVLGLESMALVIASLWLPMNMGWNFRFSEKE